MTIPPTPAIAPSARPHRFGGRSRALFAGALVALVSGSLLATVPTQAHAAVDEADYANILSNFSAVGQNYTLGGEPSSEAPADAADGGRLLTNTSGRAVVSFDVAIPDDAEPGDEIVLSTNSDNWRWTSFQPVELSTPSGAVVATAQGFGGENSRLVLSLTEEVDHLGDIEVGFQGTLSSMPRHGEHRWNVPVELFSPGGAELTGGEYAFNVRMNSGNVTVLGLSNHISQHDNSLIARAIAQYRDVRGDGLTPLDPSKVEFSVTALTQGAIPVCGENPYGTGGITWILDDGQLLADPFKQTGEWSCDDVTMNGTLGADVRVPTEAEVLDALGDQASERTGRVVTGARMVLDYIVDTPMKQYDFEGSAHGAGIGNEVNGLVGFRFGGVSSALSGHADGVPLPSGVSITKTLVTNTATEVSYDITVTNTSPRITAYGVVVTDHVPAGLTFASASHDGVHADGTITWPSADLAPKESVTHRVVLIRDAGVQPGDITTDTGATGENVEDASTELVIPAPDANGNEETPGGTPGDGAGTGTEGGSAGEVTDGGTQGGGKTPVGSDKKGAVTGDPLAGDSSTSVAGGLALLAGLLAAAGGAFALRRRQLAQR